MATGIDLRVSLQKVLRDLYDRTVSVAVAPKFEPTPAKPAAVAIYATNADSVSGLLVCAIPVAAYAAAALSLLPKSAAEECARKNELNDQLLENFHELANIGSSLFAEQLGIRIHLSHVVAKVTSAPDKLFPITAPTKRWDFNLDIPNYGSGLVSIRSSRL